MSSASLNSTTTAPSSLSPSSSTSPNPLVTHIYTADPSAHVFNDRLYIYPSHDRETTIQFNDNGDQYDMADYHVLSLSSIPSPTNPTIAPPTTDHGVALTTEDVPWASKQLWAPDAATKNGKYYLYFPARDKQGIFRIGVAVSDKPEGPFSPDPDPIPGSYSIDPASFVDDDDPDATSYLYFGGIWGGQLQCWQDPNAFDASLSSGPQREPHGPDIPALSPRIAKLTPDMKSFDGPVRSVQILDPVTLQPLLADDHDRRFFEASWMHKYKGVYYFSYSTGDTHYIVYATGDNPYGPFVYRGRILDPVVGWTTHHSIVEFGGKWWLFYHDCELSRGVSHLRSVKMREIVYDAEGRIQLANPQ